MTSERDLRLECINFPEDCGFVEYISSDELSDPDSIWYAEDENLSCPECQELVLLYSIR